MGSADVGAGGTERSIVKRRVALAAPVVVPLVMYPVFQVARVVLGDALGGYLAWGVGLAVYWVVWGLAFSFRMLGVEGVRSVLAFRRTDPLTLSIVAIPIVVVLAGRIFVAGTAYEAQGMAVSLLLVGTAVGNGILEEVSWRGVYLRLFGERWLLQTVWPSIWFGVWHVAPASVAPGSDGAFGLVIGSVFFGLVLAVVARRAGTVWWSILTHTVSGLTLVL